MSYNKSAIYVTRTAAFIALLVAAQWATAPLGSTLVTGSVVNLILIVAVVTGGSVCGITVAAVSPFFAKLIGIGPLWSLIPFIAAGNIALCAVWHVICGAGRDGKFPVRLIAAVAAALTKFLTLYAGIVRFAVPLLLRLPEQQAVVISGMFSLPQFVTALTGGAFAAILLPLLKRAIKPASSQNGI